MKEVIVRSKKYGDQVAFVDDADFDLVNSYKWSIEKGKRTFYAGSNSNGNKYTKMHRLILGLTDSSINVDHADENGLNNTRSNLRTCTASENNRNIRKKSDKTSSKYKGVCAKGNRWRAYISVDNVRTELGIYEKEVDAAFAYNLAATNLHGEFANLNEIDQSHNFSGPIKRSKTSKFRGVRYRKESNRFNALISINKKRISIGNYDTELEAAQKYNEFALLHLGDKAKLNQI